MKLPQGLTSEMLQVFETLPDLYLILSPQLRILTASNAYLEATLTSRESLISKHIFEAFPDNPATPDAQAVSNLNASLQQVLISRKPHQMALQHYDVPHPTLAGQFVERYWLPLNTPVLNEQGEISYIIHKVNNVTEQIRSQTRLKATQEQKIVALADASQQQNRIQQLYEQAPVGIAIFIGADYMIELANPTLCEIWGRVPEQVLGKPLFEALPEASRQGFEELLDQVLQTGIPYRGEEFSVIIFREGQKNTVYFNFIYQPLRNEQQQVIGVIVVATEVSALVQARRQAEQREAVLQALNEQLAMANEEIQASQGRIRVAYQDLSKAQDALQRLNQELEQRVIQRTQQLQQAQREAETRARQLQLLTDALPVAVTYIDTQQRYQFANRTVQEWMQQEVIGKTMREVIGEQTYQVVRSYIERALAGEPVQFVQQIDYPTGRRHILMNLVPHVEEGGVKGFYGLVIDISQQISAQEMIEKREREAQTLAQELGVANEELSMTNRQLLHSNADMDNFIYTASHDLRAPITNIEGLMKALLRKLSPENLQDPTLMRITGMIGDSIERFKKTINDLGLITRIQREGNEDSILISLAEVIEQVKLDLELLIQESDVSLEIQVEDCPKIAFSPKNLRSIVYNLLSNAIKYRSPQRSPLIHISYHQEPGYVVLTVQDNGLGMDLSRENKIFALFKRLHTHVEGSGIGLYMIKKIIDNAGGKIEVESQEGKGSTFRVYFKN
jgi:PAS domain S-box-containing protein